MILLLRDGLHQFELGPAPIQIVILAMDFEVGVAAQKIPQEAQAESAERQLLYFKERFVGEDHPGRQVMEGFSVKLRKLGFDATTIGRGPVRPELDAMLATKGLDENLNLRRRVTRPTAP